uniref:RNA-directed DNA polymerase from mobile element jockey n=1 Tax=Schizaphis graminum TaxID=13262 RepID=A0A2S2PG82_SCHGA
MAANQLTKSITILLWNANGILNNINELQISLIENQVDIAMISETHLTNNSAFKIFGYNILRAYQPDGTTHGGSSLIISNKIAHTPYLPSTSLDMQISDTSLLIGSVPVSIASAYLPPGRKFPENELLQYLSTLNHTFLQGADFNAKHHCWDCSTINTRGRSLRILSEQNKPKCMHLVHQLIGLLT